MLSRDDQETLTRVGPCTPMGELLRRYWIPAALSADLVAGGPIRRMMHAFQESLKQYPPIPPGAPDDYVPRAR